MKSIWQGTISFGLVNIGVKMYSAVSETSLGFTLLCGTCKHPIKYVRWCPHCKKEIAWNNIVKGLKVDSKKYFIATPEALAKLKPAKSNAIDIIEFIDAQALEPIYFKDDYYLGPNKPEEKSYFLLKKVLEQTNKIAIGSFVMKEKEHVAAITPYKYCLLLSTLHYAYEIKDDKAIPHIGKMPKISQAELTLAKKLVAQLTKKKFDITKFKDTFAENLKKAIKSGKKMKLRQKKIEIKPDTTLLARLRQSVQPERVHARSRSVY